MGETGVRRLEDEYCTLKPPYQRRTIGMDHFSVTPPTSDGYKGCLLLVEHFSHFPVAYPVKSFDADTVAAVLFKHFCTHGKFEEIASDQGSAFMADVVQQLNGWL